MHEPPTQTGQTWVDEVVPYQPRPKSFSSPCSQQIPCFSDGDITWRTAMPQKMVPDRAVSNGNWVSWERHKIFQLCRELGRDLPGIIHYDISYQIRFWELKDGKFGGNWILINPDIKPQGDWLAITNHPLAIPLDKGWERSKALPNTGTTPLVSWMPNGVPSKYLSRNQLAQREFVEDADHANFRRHGSLNSLTRRKPRPPSNLTRLDSNLSKLVDHKNFLIILSMRIQVLLGRGRTMEI